MYENDFSTLDFLNTTFILMKNKVQKIKELNNKQKKGKLPLNLLQEKLESTSNVLHALTHLINMLDYSKPEAEDITELYNTIGYRLSIANLDMDDKMYQNVIDIIESFID